jgi:hypothetical protein
MLNFPSSPTSGQKYPQPPVAGQPVYTWDGEKWTTIGGALDSGGAATALPLADATPGVVGLSTKYAREDHIHPTDTTRAPIGAGAHGQVYFGFVSATQVKLAPFNGNAIKIAGTTYNLAAAVTANNTGCYLSGTAGQTLAASTGYYVYVFNNAGTLTLDFCPSATTTHAQDIAAGNVGVEIKTGNNSRTLVGFVSLNASAQFQDDSNARLVASWFNKRKKSIAFAYTNTGGSATALTVYCQSSLSFSWSGDSVDAVLYADVGNTNSWTGFGLSTSDNFGVPKAAITYTYQGTACPTTVATHWNTTADITFTFAPVYQSGSSGNTSGLNSTIVYASVWG